MPYQVPTSTQRATMGRIASFDRSYFTSDWRADVPDGLRFREGFGAAPSGPVMIVQKRANFDDHVTAPGRQIGQALLVEPRKPDGLRGWHYWQAHCCPSGCWGGAVRLATAPSRSSPRARAFRTPRCRYGAWSWSACTRAPGNCAPTRGSSTSCWLTGSTCAAKSPRPRRGPESSLASAAEPSAAPPAPPGRRRRTPPAGHHRAPPPARRRRAHHRLRRQWPIQ